VRLLHLLVPLFAVAILDTILAIIVGCIVIVIVIIIVQGA